MKSSKYLERITKGTANHRRIDILKVLSNNSNQSLFDIAEVIRVNFRTASEHTGRLVRAGLVTKRYEGRIVRHSITPLGMKVLNFLETIE